MDEAIATMLFGFDFGNLEHGGKFPGWLANHLLRCSDPTEEETLDDAIRGDTTGVDGLDVELSQLYGVRFVQYGYPRDCMAMGVVIAVRRISGVHDGRDTERLNGMDIYASRVRLNNALIHLGAPDTVKPEYHLLASFGRHDA